MQAIFVSFIEKLKYIVFISGDNWIVVCSSDFWERSGAIRLKHADTDM